jgi:hypothetical protein
MKKTQLVVLTVFLTACNNKADIAERFKLYMKDTVVKGFNDPSSYEFVSIKIDTFRGKDYIENTRSLYKRGDTILHTAQRIEEKLSEADSLGKIPGYSDSVWNYQAELSFRGKNKMGALVLDKVNLTYTPASDKIEARDK